MITLKSLRTPTLLVGFLLFSACGDEIVGPETDLQPSINQAGQSAPSATLESGNNDALTPIPVRGRIPEKPNNSGDDRLP